jgi:hypothetical protein
MTEAEKRELWSGIKSFEIDDPEATYSFSDRLSTENGWPLAFALAAIDEYKKFMFLQCVSDDSLTPSDQVDQVWHLHLLYTRSYWDEFCGKILQRRIHHGPTKGGTKERTKFSDRYQKTLTLYKENFDQTPPGDIWPNVNDRFSDIHFRRINIATHWIIRKPSILKS